MCVCVCVCACVCVCVRVCVRIVTDYGLDDPESNPGGDEIFPPTRPATWSTQPPVKRIPGLSQG